MPEFPEVTAYRHVAERAVGDIIESIDIRDERLLRRGDDPAVVYGVLGGARIDRVRSIGKVLLFELASDRTFALTFGLRGWLSVDGKVADPSGHFRPRAPRPEHLRLVLVAGGREFELEDQLRLATLELDFDEDRLGPDVQELDKSSFREIVDGSAAVLKSLLMNQGRIAGIGNLIADEIFYQASIDPRRSADSLDDDEFDALWDAVYRTRRRVVDKGGSHRGVLIDAGARSSDEPCPRCGVGIIRTKVSGRTTYLCPEHQT